MTLQQLDRFCAALPATTRSVQWGNDIVFKVGGKMFCVIGHEGREIAGLSFKSAPEHYEALSHAPGFRPAPYLARAKWVLVDDPKALRDAELKAYIKRAHAVVGAGLSKKKQKELGLQPTASAV